MTSDINATPAPTPEPASLETAGAASPAVDDELDTLDEVEPPHGLTVKLRAAGESATHLAIEAKTAAVGGAHLARNKLTEASVVGVQAAKRVPHMAWMAAGIGVAAVGLGLLARRRRGSRRH